VEPHLLAREGILNDALKHLSVLYHLHCALPGGPVLGFDVVSKLVDHLPPNNLHTVETAARPVIGSACDARRTQK
jgi:hypothetical protein